MSGENVSFGDFLNGDGGNQAIFLFPQKPKTFNYSKKAFPVLNKWTVSGITTHYFAIKNHVYCLKTRLNRWPDSMRKFRLV